MTEEGRREEMETLKLLLDAWTTRWMVVMAPRWRNSEAGSEERNETDGHT